MWSPHSLVQLAYWELRAVEHLHQSPEHPKHSVPVVEVGGNRLVGNVTSEHLAELIAQGQPRLAAS